MLNYEEFKEKIMTKFIGYLPKKFWNSHIEINSIPKVNGCMEAIHIMPMKENSALPTIYINQMYDNYRECGDINKVFTETADFFMEGLKYAESVRINFNFSEVESNIVFSLINTEENKELLLKAPSREFLDLSIIYRIVIKLEDGTFNSVIVTYEIADKMNMNEEELYEAAYEKSDVIFPPMSKFFSDDFCMITNEYGINGASVVIYKYILQDIADKMNGDIYIIPSSIHEIIALSVKISNPESLKKMIYDANNTVVSENEILSYNLYYYDRTKRNVYIA